MADGRKGPQRELILQHIASIARQRGGHSQTRATRSSAVSRHEREDVTPALGMRPPPLVLSLLRLTVYTSLSFLVCVMCVCDVYHYACV